jgi:ketosteroid isomerase-like protein
MSQENVEIADKLIQLFNARDLEGVLKLSDPGVEHRPALEGSVEGTGVFHGHDGVRRWWRQLEETWSEWSVEIDEIRDLGPRLVVLGVVRFRGTLSGTCLESPLASVMTLRGGKLVRKYDYFDRGEALEAVALSE